MAISVVTGALLLNMVLGITIQSWGNLTVYVTSYLRTIEPHLEYEDTAWVTAVTGCMVGFTSYLGGWLLELQGPRLTSLIGGLTVSVGIGSSAMFIKYGFIPFLFSFSALVGLGCGIVFSAPLDAVMKLLPERRGFITGLVMCGSSIGPMAAVYLETWLVNPDNDQPQAKGRKHEYFTDDKLLDRVPLSLVMLGLFTAMLSVVGAFLLSEPSKDIPESRSSSVESQVLTTNRIRVSYAPSQVVRMSDFWLMWFCYFFNMLNVNWVMNMVKVFAQGRGFSDHVLTSIVSIAAICNGLGRLGWGCFSDQFSFRLAIILMSIIKALCVMRLDVSANTGYVTYLISVSLIYSSIGGVSSVWAGAVNLYFGPEHFGRNFGLLLVAGGAGWIVGAILMTGASAVPDTIQTYCAGGFSFAASLCGCLLRSREDFEESNSKQLSD